MVIHPKIVILLMTIFWVSIEIKGLMHMIGFDGHVIHGYTCNDLYFNGIKRKMTKVIWVVI
jgi:hypothetical protein